MAGFLLLQVPIDFFLHRQKRLAIVIRRLRKSRSARLGLVRELSAFTLDHIIQNQ